MSTLVYPLRTGPGMFPSPYLEAPRQRLRALCVSASPCSVEPVTTTLVSICLDTRNEEGVGSYRIDRRLGRSQCQEYEIDSSFAVSRDPGLVALVSRRLHVSRFVLPAASPLLSSPPRRPKHHNPPDPASSRHARPLFPPCFLCSLAKRNRKKKQYYFHHSPRR